MIGPYAIATLTEKETEGGLEAKGHTQTDKSILEAGSGRVDVDAGMGEGTHSNRHCGFSQRVSLIHITLY